MEEWKEYKLGDVCDFQEGYVNPPQGNPEYFDGDVKWLRATDLNDGYVYSTTRTLTQLGFKSARKSAILFKPGTIAISKSGTIGRLGILQDYMCGNRAVINIIPHHTVNTYFVFLVLRSYQRYFPLMAVGSVQKNLYISILEDLKINLPDLNTQDKIVSILSSLDDKIELNRKINANLEAQAQALFKSWFVDFEPFKDQPFVESELGMIPEGWRVVSLDKIAEISKSSINPQKYPELLFEHYSIPSFDDGLKPEKQFGGDIKSNKFVITNKMTLFSKLNPRIKRVWYVDKLASYSICSTEFVPYKAQEESKSPFVYGLINSQVFYDFVMSMVNGATGSHQRFHPEESMKFKIAYDDDYVSRYCNLASPILSLILNYRDESRRLASLRDTLLPRLMSGELNVFDKPNDNS